MVIAMKKIKMSREMAYVFGICIMPFAVACTIKANLGMSMIAAPSFIISEKIPLTNGQVEWIMQGLFLVLMCVVIKKFKLTYLGSFVSAIIYGALLDLANWLIGMIPIDSLSTAPQMAARVVLFIMGMVLTSFSVAMFFNTYLPPCAYDFFVREIGSVKKLDMRKWKLTYDASMFAFALSLTLILFHKFVGVSVGTLVMVVCNGNIIAFFSKMFDKRIEFFDRFNFAKYF